MDTGYQARAVAVMQLPETVNPKQGRFLFNEVESCMSTVRPNIVLDCSKVSQMDGSCIHLLLCCLEEAMKRNGNVKLAMVPPEARTILGLTGVGQLFEIFETNADAANSFHRPRTISAPHFGLPDIPQQAPLNAA